jgi:glycyl-tRNA synthetase beta chain
VNNLAQKATSSKVDIELFETEAERNLWTAFTAVKQEGEALLEAKEFGKALARMAELKSDIDAFFDNVMVMVEDEKVKANRLALLASIAVFIFGLADFSKIVFA